MPKKAGGNKKMKKERENQKAHRRKLIQLAGAFIESWPELNHITIIYEVNPARVGNQVCTICNKGEPIILRYERDHMAQEFYDVLCKTCTPLRLKTKARSGYG